MPLIQLPRTRGCLVCGRDNPHGLQLRLWVNDATGDVSTEATPDAHYAGFTDVVHGGLVATIADETMVWAATWAGKRFCLCGELTVRFRKPARPGMRLRFVAKVTAARSRLITTEFLCADESGQELSSGSAKYVPISPGEHARVVESFLLEPASQQSAAQLAAGK